jgi:hypothetical protein
MEDLIDTVKISELREQLKEIGIITENQNMFPLFESTLQPRYEKRVFKGENWKLTIQGRLGQEHKNLLEVILCRKYLYDFIEIGNEHLQVLYNEKKIQRYMSKISEYSHEKYEELLKDMMQTVIVLKLNDPRIDRSECMVSERIVIKDFKPPQKMSSIIPEKVPLSIMTFGTMTTIFIENEFTLPCNQNQFELKIEIYRKIFQEITSQMYDEMGKLFASFTEDNLIITYSKMNR